MGKQIAVLMSAINISNQKKIFEGMIDAAKKTDSNLFVFTCHINYNEKEENKQGAYQIMRLPDFRYFDGAVIVRNTIQHEPTANRVFAALKESGIPAVSIDSEMQEMDYIGISNYEAQYQLVEHLIKEHGCRDICYIAGPSFNEEASERKRALDDTRYVMPSINGVFASGDDIGQIMAEVLEAAGDTSGNVNNFMQAMDAHMDDIITHPIVSGNLERAAAGWDLIGYNYMTARYEQDKNDYPNRVIVGSETYPPEIARNWEIIRRCSNVIGDFTWTGWDYIGEAGVGIPAYLFGEGGFGAKFPCQLAYTGDIDITGFRRPASYFREIVFGRREKPYIAVQNPEKYGRNLIKTPWVLSDSVSSWTYRGFEGKPVVVEVYAPGDEVELLINGASLGRKPAGEAAGYIVRFETVYTPGVLEAVAYKNGAALGRTALTTAADGERRIRIDREEGNELLYLPVSVCDASGNVFTDETLTITCTVAGDAELLGWGSADPKPKYNYIGNITETWNGRALAILKPMGVHGRAQVSVSAGELTAEKTLEW